MNDRGERHPDFEPGNELAVRHGAYSPVLMAEAARPMATMLAAIEPRLADPAFELELESYCEAHAARRALMVDIRQRQEAGEKIPQRHWESLATLTNAAHRIANAFGLTPFARARLDAVLTTTEMGQAALEDLAQQGRRVRLKIIDGEVVDDADESQS